MSYVKKRFAAAGGASGSAANTAAPQGFGRRRNMGAPTEKPKDGGKTLRRLLAYFASHRAAVFVLFLTVTATVLLRIAAPLLLMCSPHDIVVTYQVKCTFTQQPTLILYDNCPGGVGISEKAYHMRSALFDSARTIVRDCGCENGCPSCAGPVAEIGANGKRLAAELLERLCKMNEPGQEE